MPKANSKRVCVVTVPIPKPSCANGYGGKKRVPKIGFTSEDDEVRLSTGRSNVDEPTTGLAVQKRTPSIDGIEYHNLPLATLCPVDRADKNFLLPLASKHRPDESSLSAEWREDQDIVRFNLGTEQLVDQGGNDLGGCETDLAVVLLRPGRGACTVVYEHTRDFTTVEIPGRTGSIPFRNLRGFPAHDELATVECVRDDIADALAHPRLLIKEHAGTPRITRR